MRQLIAFVIGVSLIFVLMTRVEAHDPEHRDHDQWYASIKMPDSDTSCCGVSDAYFCNRLEVKGDQTFCTITDTRDNASRKRPPVPVGTKVLIPANKLVKDAEARKGNPTGQGVIWMRAGYVNGSTGEPMVTFDPKDYTVFCFFAPDLT